MGAGGALNDTSTLYGTPGNEAVALGLDRLIDRTVDMWSIHLPNQDGNGEKPSWWPDGVPHPSDDAKKTTCAVEQPDQLPQMSPDPGKGCKSLFDNMLKRCESKPSRAGRIACASKAFAVYMICQTFKGD